MSSSRRARRSRRQPKRQRSAHGSTSKLHHLCWLNHAFLVSSKSDPFRAGTAPGFSPVQHYRALQKQFTASNLKTYTECKRFCGTYSWRLAAIYVNASTSCDDAKGGVRSERTHDLDHVHSITRQKVIGLDSMGPYHVCRQVQSSRVVNTGVVRDFTAAWKRRWHNVSQPGMVSMSELY